MPNTNRFSLSRGRPPIDPNLRRTFRMQIMLMPSERALLDAAALADGMPTGPWIRGLAVKAARALVEANRARAKLLDEDAT